VLYLNDHDSDSLAITGPDGQARTVTNNSVALFADNVFIGAGPFDNTLTYPDDAVESWTGWIYDRHHRRLQSISSSMIWSWTFWRGKRGARRRPPCRPRLVPEILTCRT